MEELLPATRQNNSLLPGLQIAPILSIASGTQQPRRSLGVEDEHESKREVRARGNLYTHIPFPSFPFLSQCALAFQYSSVQFFLAWHIISWRGMVSHGMAWHGKWRLQQVKSSISLTAGLGLSGDGSRTMDRWGMMALCIYLLVYLNQYGI